MDALCKSFRARYENRRHHQRHLTKEDAEFLTAQGRLRPERIIGVETGGCPHTAIRETLDEFSPPCGRCAPLSQLDVVLIESGGDNLTSRPSAPNWRI